MLTESNINVNALSSLRNSCKLLRSYFFIRLYCDIFAVCTYLNSLSVVVAKANKKADGSHETSSSTSSEAVEEVGGQG